MAIGVATVAANGGAVWWWLRSDASQGVEADRPEPRARGVNVQREASFGPAPAQTLPTAPTAPAASEQGPGDAPASLAKAIADLEARGELPVLDRTDSLTGVDADGNGIRDDLDRYIDRSFGDPAQREAAIRLTKTIQQTLLVDVRDQTAVMEVARKYMRHLDCFSSRFPSAGAEGPRLRMELHSLTTNTKTRLLAHLQFNHALGGQAFRLSEGDGCA